MVSSNFHFLEQHDELLVRLAHTAESCFVPDPNTTLIKMRQLGEELAKTIAARVGVEFTPDVKQVDLLRELDNTLRLDREIKDAFHSIRKLGNEAAHDLTSSNHRDALKALQIGHALAVWFHTTFGGDKAKGFKPERFKKPNDPSEKVRSLEEALNEMELRSRDATDRLQQAELIKAKEAEKAEAERIRAEQMALESQVWQELAQEHEQTLASYRAKMDAANVLYLQSFNQQSPELRAQQINRIEKSKLHLNEAETRVLIDEQLIEAGWIADSVNLKFSK